MSIGYACLTIGVPQTNFRTCIMKNVNDDKLKEIINYNLNSLENIIDYNIQNNIKLFRITSDLIPFGSSSVNKLPWQNLYRETFQRIGEKILANNIRVSMHPGQYTVLNSPNPDVVNNAIKDLNYHCSVLDALGVGPEHKIILHIGGVYDDKPNSMSRFIVNYKRLKDSVKKRLVIENDDRSYTISDVLNISKQISCPVIFDNLHNKLNGSEEEKEEMYWIKECKKTWKKEDGLQKIHYSQQNPYKNPGSHSDTICLQEFLDFYHGLNRQDIDIMLEVKDKNLSATKCINGTRTDLSIEILEQEWIKYQYSVLEKSYDAYEEIKKLLKIKEEYHVIPFYTLIEKALQLEDSIPNSIQAAKLVWSSIKDHATSKETKNYYKNIISAESGNISIQRIKNQLRRLAEKYEITHLLECYYFEL